MTSMEEFLEDDVQKGKFLTFALDDGVFGIEISSVDEIIGLQPITHVPEAPSYVKGVINLRGRILPVMDVRLKFKREPLEYNEKTCIIVINMNEITVGLIVDRVIEVIYISDENIVPPPEFKMGFQNQYIKGVSKSDDKITLLLDCDRLLSDEDYDKVSQI